MPINFISSLCGLCFIIMFGVKKKKMKWKQTNLKTKNKRLVVENKHFIPSLL